MGIESYHIPPGLQPECWTLPGLQWESSSLPDSSGNTRGRVKHRRKVETRPYKHAPARRIQLLEENETSLPRTWDCTCLRIHSDALEEHSQASAFRSVLSKDKRRHNPPPTSISMALNKNHPISHLPGMNSNYGGTGYKDEEWPSPWTQIHSKYGSGHHGTSQSNKNTRFIEQKDIRQPSGTHEHHNSLSWTDNDNW